jgi:hypothetical protein
MSRPTTKRAASPPGVRSHAANRVNAGGFAPTGADETSGGPSAGLSISDDTAWEHTGRSRQWRCGQEALGDVDLGELNVQKR